MVLEGATGEAHLLSNSANMRTRMSDDMIVNPLPCALRRGCSPGSLEHEINLCIRQLIVRLLRFCFTGRVRKNGPEEEKKKKKKMTIQ
jgi:hypothetical protein